jgi:hypothetical protein
MVCREILFCKRIAAQVRTCHSALAAALALLLMLPSCFLMDTGEVGYGDGYAKGMNIFFMHSRNAYRPAEYDASLDELKGVGVNTVFLITFHYVKTAASDSIFTNGESIPDSTLAAIIEHTLARGLTPILKPHIDVLDATPRYRIQPAHIERWIGCYRQILQRSVALSKRYGLTTLVVGTELDVVAETPQFQALLRDEIRPAFDGQLWYAASFDHFLSCSVWPVVDAIGVNGYFNLCQRDDCSQGELLESWNYWLNTLERFSHAHAKPVYITEIGYYSRAGCAINPGDWSRGGAVDFAEQAQAYEALLSQAHAFGSIKGIFWWQWELNNPWGNNRADYTPQDKPAQDVLARYWGQ